MQNFNGSGECPSGAGPPLLPTPEQVLMILNDNHETIKAIVENQRLGRFREVVAYQQRLYSNLSILARFLDEPNKLAIQLRRSLPSEELQRQIQAVRNLSGGQLSQASCPHTPNIQTVSGVPLPSMFYSPAHVAAAAAPNPSSGSSSNSSAFRTQSGTGPHQPRFPSVSSEQPQVRASTGLQYPPSRGADAATNSVLGPPVPQPMREMLIQNPGVSEFMWSDDEHYRLQDALANKGVSWGDLQTLSFYVQSRSAEEVGRYLNFITYLKQQQAQTQTSRLQSSSVTGSQSLAANLSTPSSGAGPFSGGVGSSSTSVNNKSTSATNKNNSNVYSQPAQTRVTAQTSEFLSQLASVSTVGNPFSSEYPVNPENSLGCASSFPSASVQLLNPSTPFSAGGSMLDPQMMLLMMNMISQNRIAESSGAHTKNSVDNNNPQNLHVSNPPPPSTNSVPTMRMTQYFGPSNGSG